MPIDKVSPKILTPPHPSWDRSFSYQEAASQVRGMLGPSLQTGQADLRQYMQTLTQLRRAAERATIPPNGTFYPLGHPLDGIKRGIDHALLGVKSGETEYAHQSLQLLQDTLIQHVDEVELFEVLPKAIGNFLRFFNLAGQRGILHTPFSLSIFKTEQVSIAVDCSGDHSDLRIETPQSPFDSISISQKSPLSLDGDPTQLTHLLKNLGVPAFTWKNLTLELHQLAPHLQSHAFYI